MRANPYTPGAGCVPSHLVGREHLIEMAEDYLKNIQAGYPQQSVIYYDDYDKVWETSLYNFGCSRNHGA